MLALLLACGDGSEADGDVEQGAESEAVERPEADTLQQTDTLPPPMPEFPEPREGHLTTAITGDHEFELTGSWEAWAGRCGAGPLVQLVARGQGFGTIVLLTTPDSGSPVGSYEVKPGVRGLPESFEARIGVQEYPERRSYVFDAVEGEVVVDSLSERLYGRLIARLRGRNRSDTVPFAGVFHNIEVRELEDEWCQTHQEEADSLSSEGAL
jgi:hypothetical protein